MEELARWDDVDVFYMNQQVKDYHFSAWFKRSSSINEVINILEKTKKISLDLKGRILTVKAVSYTHLFTPIITGETNVEELKSSLKDVAGIDVRIRQLQ